MKKILKIKSLKRALTLTLGFCALCAPTYAEEPESKPLPHIDTDCIFTYYTGYTLGGVDFEYTRHYRLTDRAVDEKDYMAFIECDENGDFIDKSKVLAYLREEENKIYMILGNAKAPYWLNNAYGLTDRETMIYDFSLNTGESYRIGELSDYYVVENPEEDIEWVSRNYNGPYTYLCAWGYGEITVRQTWIINSLKRKAWTMAQKFYDPELLHGCGVKPGVWDDRGWRTFDVVDGFGCMQSLLPFPGLFPPCPNIITGDAMPDNPILCKVKRLGTKEVLFERTDLELDNVEQLDAERNEVPRYYDLQGVELQEPAEGICIVRRGNRATKEFIRR